MNTRKLKIVALLATGGVLLQAGGCAAAAIQIIGQQILSGVLSTILQTLIGSATGSTA